MLVRGREVFSGVDKSAMGAAGGRHGHAEHIRSAQCKLREASGGPARQTLRYAQGDKRGPWRQTLRYAQGDKGTRSC